MCDTTALSALSSDVKQGIRWPTISKLMIEDTAMTCADSVEVTAMKVISRIAVAPPFPAMVMAK
jgi:hypothetical protein